MRTALTIAAVALGVAVVLAIELAGEAAAGSFRSSVETLARRRRARSDRHRGHFRPLFFDRPGATPVSAQAPAAH